MFFRSERLFLRPGWPEDWAALQGSIGHGQLAPALPGDARAFTAPAQDRRYPQFLVTLPHPAADTASEVIGGIGLNRCVEGGAGEPDLGVWIARERWGQGYATEAGRALLTLARTLGHRRLRARHAIDNPAAGRVLAKLGFRPVGAVASGRSGLPGKGVLVQSLALDLANAGGDDDGGERETVPMPRAA